LSAPAASPKRILIIRLSAIGDVIMASALIPALRGAFPEAHIAWLAEDINAGLLRHNPRLDRVIVWPRRRWRQLLQERRYRQCLGECHALVRELRQERFDWVLDLQGLLKSGLWAWLSGGRTRIGLGSREGSQFLMSRVVDRRSTSTRIGKEYLKLADELGIQPAHFPMDIVPSEQERMEACALLQTFGIVASGRSTANPHGSNVPALAPTRDPDYVGWAKRSVPITGGPDGHGPSAFAHPTEMPISLSPFAVIAPFTTRPQKHWFDERWAELAIGLAQEQGFRVVMLGGPGEQAHAEAIAAQMPGLCNLVGKTSLGQCAAIIEKARLLIGVDTGLTHLGIAMRTPTLALFGSTRPYLDPGVDYARVLYQPLPCSPCKRRPTCGGAFDCMRAHTVESVLKAATALRNNL
jgi:heptosyltransferase-1